MSFSICFHRQTCFISYVLIERVEPSFDICYCNRLHFFLLQYFFLGIQISRSLDPRSRFCLLQSNRCITSSDFQYSIVIHNPIKTSTDRCLGGASQFDRISWLERGHIQTPGRFDLLFTKHHSRINHFASFNKEHFLIGNG
jgi:hypothetical protein